MPDNQNTPPPRQRRTRSKSEWQALFKEFYASSCTQEHFCKKHKISSSTFHKWRRRLFTSSEQTEGPTFIDIAEPLGVQTQVSTQEPKPWDIELELASACTLKIRLP